MNDIEDPRSSSNHPSYDFRINTRSLCMMDIIIQKIIQSLVHPFSSLDVSLIVVHVMLAYMLSMGMPSSTEIS